jgi:hypothetical protein
MLNLSTLAIVLSMVGPSWQTNYAKAYHQALDSRKDLVIYFRDAQGQLDDALNDENVKASLDRFVCLRVPANYQFQGDRLLDDPALREMMGRPGLVIVSLHEKDMPTHREAISVHPLVGSRYGWVPAYGPDQVKTILDLPQDATLTQRSMLYALRVHPERPQSVYCECHPAFLGHAQRHSDRQARMRHQHHADIIAASSRLSSEVGEALGGASEVVAESWGNVVGGENVLEAAFSCVDAWRHSSGHWSAVSHPHRYFGYDIARADSGTWYATGIFAD